jgi:D-methionine transport system substrate-binding protein
VVLNYVNYPILVALLFIGICFSPVSEAASQTTIRAGVTDGPQEEIMRQVKQLAVSQNLDIEIIPYVKKSGLINRALSSGKLDVASFQDAIALEADIKAHRYALTQAALTVTLPMGIYSRKIKSLRALKPGVAVAIPRNSADKVRALRLLHIFNLIKLPGTFSLKGTVQDIVKNPFKLRFVEVQNDKLLRSLDTESLVTINYREATKAGLYPARDALGFEDSSTPYSSVLTIRTADKQKPWVDKLVSIYHSLEIKRFILEHYQDSVRRPW